MTNEEYKQFALQIHDMIIDDFEIVDNYEITNIGELFVLKLHEGFKSLNEPMSPIEIEKDMNALGISHDVKENENNEPFFEPEITQNTDKYFINVLFLGLKYAVDSWGDIEYTLSKLGVKNPERIINSVKNMDGILDSDKRYALKQEIINELLFVNGGERMSDFLFYLFFASYRNYIINICKKTSRKNLFELLQICKYLGSNYKSVCEDRVVFYNFLLKKISCNINKLSEIFEEFDVTYILDKLERYSFDKLFESDDDIEVTDGYKIFFVDLLFLSYYFIYQNPRYLVKFSFYLLYKNTSPQMQEAMYNSFRSGETNTLIQFEYEWWCSETSKSLDLPFPFSSQPFNRINTTIVDYDLNDVKYNTDKFINQPKLIIYKEPTTQVVEKNKRIVTRDTIIHDLYPNFKIFMNMPNQTRGSFFIAHYLDNIIGFTETIKDSYNAYGFAYILFNSKYFNWYDAKFDDNFASKIVSIFGINIEDNKTYFESKARECAKKIVLHKVSFQGILNEDILKLFDL